MSYSESGTWWQSSAGLRRLLTRDGAIEELSARIAESAGPVGVVSFGIDGFTALIEALGLDRGDELLHSIAHRVRSGLPAELTAAWMGGGEFVVLMPGSDDGAAEWELVGVLQNLLSDPFAAADGGEHRLRFSVGIVSGVAGAVAVELLLDSRIARRHATEQRARAVWYEPGFRVQAQRRQAVERDLRETLENTPERLTVVYQPIIDLPSRRAVGYEALVRWRHSERGLLMPADFILVAEESGLIAELGQHVLSSAIREFATFAPRSLSLAVNLSEYELADPDLPERVAGLLNMHGLPADRLCVEITETALAGDDEVTAGAAARLRALGVGVALDDFGSGTASLARLGSLPITSIKTPKQFVDALGGEGGAEASAVLTGIVTMATASGLDVVVEGVETTEQENAVIACGAERVQGYKFGRPRPIAALFGV